MVNSNTECLLYGALARGHFVQAASRVSKLISNLQSVNEREGKSQMGEAARRKSEIELLKAKNQMWIDSLLPEEKIVAAVAQATFDKVVCGLGMTEGCYNLAFFLYEHLRRKHGIEVKVVLGWINDGLWEGAASHAWVEYQGKRIDISLHKTSHPEAQPSGDVIILDHIFRRGKVSYTYWQTLPDGVSKALEQMRISSPELIAIINHKEDEHRKMVSFASTKDGAIEYFRHVPPTNSYEYLARVVD